MSTQTSGFASVPFSITTPPQNLRLLELPPDLLELITAKDKPEKLYLKSSLPSNTTTKPSSEYLHLCTTTHVWAIKQVSTSNSVHVIRPAPTSISGLTSISLPTSHLELLPLHPTPRQILQHIHDLVPTHPSPPNSVALASLQSHLPFPTATLGPLIRQSLIFSQSPGTSTYRPSVQLQLTAWKALLSTVTSTGVSLATTDGSELERVVRVIEEEEGEVVGCVVRAVIDRFGDGMVLGEEVRESGAVGGKLKGEDVVVWVGELVVRSKEDGRVGKEMLLEEWTGMVPREWEVLCSIAELVENVKGMRVNGDDVRFVGPELEEKVSMSGEVVGKAGAGKRKWHERFAAQRNN